jgi:diguanylate cyclase (GGDEF)-like protein
VAGASIGLVSLLLPHSAAAQDAGLYSNVALAYLGGGVLLRFGPRLPGWALHAALLAGALLITRAVVLSGEPVSFYAGWYIWVGLYAFYFFSRAAAAAHVGLTALLYAGTLVNEPASSPLARWLTTVATLIVAGVFIDTLVRRARGQAHMAAASAARMESVAEVAHELAGLSESRAARAALCRAAAGVTDADRTVLWEPTEDGIALRVGASSGPEPAQREIPFVGPPAGAPQAFTTGMTIYDGGRSAAVTLAREFAEDMTPGACLWQPIFSDGKPIAVLGFYWDEAIGLDDPSVRALTDLFAVEAAVTLERVALLSRLEDIARTDELTGLPNRRAWQEQLPVEVMRSMRSREPVCVAMLDLDHFKDYNDRFGHQAGDRLLKQVAGGWSGELRPVDMLARYGGEEFALVLPGVAVDEALAILERLRSRTPEDQRFSAGVAAWDGAESARDLLGRADAALYQAKRQGRDRSTVAAAGGERTLEAG